MQFDFQEKLFFLESAFSPRDGKTYERASNACINFFLAWVKSLPNFTLLCCKNELCRDFALCRVILMVFRLVNR